MFQFSWIETLPDFVMIMGKNFQAMQQYDKEEQCLIKSTQIVPNRVYPYYLLTFLYLEMGDTIKAREMARLVQTKEPKAQSTAIREMREDMIKKNLAFFDNPNSSAVDPPLRHAAETCASE